MSDNVDDANLNFEVKLEETLDFIRTEVNAAFAQRDKVLVEYEEELESIRKQIATLLIAYGESSVAMEVTLDSIFKFGTDEQREYIAEQIKIKRQTMLELLNDAGEEAAEEPEPEQG
jgi:hypothetical protein